MNLRVRDVGRAIEGPVNELLAAWANKHSAIILAVQREPGANVIETVDRVKAMLPVLQASIPSAINVQILSDRTQTIRASVADVQFTLMITVALVVMVILLFLRNFWATITTPFYSSVLRLSDKVLGAMPSSESCKS
jgi:multidrug efflux pump subunit AcrB